MNSFCDGGGVFVIRTLGGAGVVGGRTVDVCGGVLRPVVGDGAGNGTVDDFAEVPGTLSGVERGETGDNAVSDDFTDCVSFGTVAGATDVVGDTGAGLRSAGGSFGTTSGALTIGTGTSADTGFGFIGCV